MKCWVHQIFKGSNDLLTFATKPLRGPDTSDITMNIHNLLQPHLHNLLGQSTSFNIPNLSRT